MRRVLTSILWLAVVAVSHAADWALPAVNQGTWVPGTNVGIPGGIDQYLAGGASDRAVTGNVINVVTAHGADNTGATDVKAAVDAAIVAASAGDVIYFPAGDYKFSTGFIYIPTGKANITIRGAGAGLTTFLIRTTQTVFIWPDPGYIRSSILAVSGTKTKGTSTLTVSSSTGYAADSLAYIEYENEVNTTRINAGAPPVWSSKGYPWSRAYTVMVTGTTSTTISIAPPLPADATNLTLNIRQWEVNPATTKVVGWGFEDFDVEYASPSYPERTFLVRAAHYHWFYNIHFYGWDRRSDNGGCIKLDNTYGVEIRKCRFDAEATAESDGAIESTYATSSLIEDNIFTGRWQYNYYDSGKSLNNVIAYNYASDGPAWLFHNNHPSLNIWEGNAGPQGKSDGYHGSSSNNTYYGNYLWDAASVVLERFKRQYVLVRNIFGKDGVATGGISWGNPNIGNGDANGFAGPTGLSDQVGQLDYQQNGGTVNTYTIQAGDVFSGDYWGDWETTATLTSGGGTDTGVFAVSGGDWHTGNSSTVASPTEAQAWWSSKASWAFNGSVTNVSGSNVTIVFTGYTLPANTTSIQLYYGSSGWQERDLDVKASSTVTHNYWSAAGGTGAVQNSSADTFPASLVYTAKPSWFGSLAWPPFNADAPVFDVTRIPAGYRYTNGNENYLNAATYSPGRLRILRR